MDGGDGLPTVEMTPEQEQAVTAFAERTASDPESNPETGAELGER